MAYLKQRLPPPIQMSGTETECACRFLSPRRHSYPSTTRFNIYIIDYCHKRGFEKTARALSEEADLGLEAQPPINAKQGLLFE